MGDAAGVAEQGLSIHGDDSDAPVGAPALRAFREVSLALLEDRDTGQVLLVIAQWARRLAGAAVASFAMPDPMGKFIAVRAADGEGAEFLKDVRVPLEGSLTSEVMATGRPRILDAADEKGRQPITLVRGMGPTLLVPLTVGGRVFGTLAVANRAGARPFDAEDVLVVQAFAAEAALALEYGQARVDLARLSVLEERDRIAMELHDGVVQTLFVAGLALQAAEAVVDDPEQSKARLSDAVQSIDRAIRDLRDYIFGLGPDELADRHLERDLRFLAEKVERSTRVKVAVDLDPRASAALSSFSASIVQAATEAVSNAVRHSGADRVALRFCCAGDAVLLEVCDNGKGFDPGQQTGGGQGLGNLRRRAEAMGGVLEIDSGPGQGTTVRIRVPS